MTGMIPMPTSTGMALCAPVKHITLEDKDSMKSAVGEWVDGRPYTPARSYIAARDSLLVEWLWHTGMRVSDALTIRFSDITASDTVRFVVQKRSHNTPFVHEISLSKAMLYDVLQYRERVYRDVSIEYPDMLFDMSRQNVDQRFAMYSKIAGLPKIGAHRLRHGCAMNLLGQGVPPVEIAFRLAHSSVQVTEAVYARMNVAIEKTMIDGVKW